MTTHATRLLRHAGTALLGLGLLSACSGAPDRPAGPSEADAAPPVRPFEAAEAQVPPGHHEELCPDLRPDGTGLSVRLVVPDGLGGVAYQRDNGCSFTGGGVEAERSVVATLGEPGTLAQTRDELEPFVSTGGDDSVQDVILLEDTAVLGGRPGERLEWYAFNDGVPRDRTAVKAEGLQLDWSVPADTRDDAAATLSVLESGAAVRQEDGAASCWTPTTSVTYVPPVPQTESIDRYQGACHVYLRPGRRSLLRYAEVDLLPRGGLDRLATTLGGRRLVTTVRLEPGAARLDGRRVDRLTYVTTRTSRTINGEPPGTWRTVVVGDDRLQATWSATPEQWREEADDARAFLASVRTA